MMRSFAPLMRAGSRTFSVGGRTTLLVSPTSSTSSYFSNIPAMAALSSGERFICGILANTSQAYCWSATNPGIDLVPRVYQSIPYSYIAARQDHVCTIRGCYYVDHDSGMVDCWEIVKSANNTLGSQSSDLYYDQSTNSLELTRIVSDEGFPCGAVREGGLICWGPTSTNLGVSNVSENFAVLASKRHSVYGISNVYGELRCWGSADSYVNPPPGACDLVGLMQRIPNPRTESLLYVFSTGVRAEWFQCWST